jgi:hypothetical protein
MKDDEDAGCAFLFSIHRELTRGNTWEEIAAGIGFPDDTADVLRCWSDRPRPAFPRGGPSGSNFLRA